MPDVILLHTLNPLNAINFFLTDGSAPSSRWAASCWP
jgi:hypothetical protein